MSKQPNPVTHKYSLTEGCSFCHGKKFKRIMKNTITSNVYCIECGEVFYNLNSEEDNAGLHAGYNFYASLPKETMYKHGSNKQPKTKLQIRSI